MTDQTNACRDQSRWEYDQSRRAQVRQNMLDNIERTMNEVTQDYERAGVSGKDALGKRINYPDVRTYIHGSQENWPYGKLFISNSPKTDNYHLITEVGYYVDSLCPTNKGLVVMPDTQWVFPGIGDCAYYREFEPYPRGFKSDEPMPFGKDFTRSFDLDYGQDPETVVYADLPKDWQENAYIQTGVSLGHKEYCPAIAKRHKDPDHPYEPAWKKFGAVGTTLEILTHPKAKIDPYGDVWTNFLETVYKPFSYACEFTHLCEDVRFTWCQVGCMALIHRAIEVSAPKAREKLIDHAQGMEWDKERNAWCRWYMH